eukprot:TRINITY_DN19343_c0_g1_i3.p2 TRINITY_DN19343_c0_g1~~TRINITY_DN19343_c0_g1_i3.p2  ORF type:complete len:121 (-),score=28.79 TRINITY_DN19343_c0_g1_i3:315-677(-)
MMRQVLLSFLIANTYAASGNITFGNYYDSNCTDMFALAELDTSLACSGGCYTDRKNASFCDSGSNFTCLADRVEYTQHIGVENCSGGMFDRSVTVHTSCMAGRSHQGTIYNKLVDYTGQC